MVIKICTMELETLIKNYAFRGITKTIAINKETSSSTNWGDNYARNLSNLLSGKDELVIQTLREIFANGFSQDALNAEDYEELKKNNQEGNDYCLRIMFQNETLCILSKREIK